MLTGMMKGLNIKKLILAVLAVFAYVFLTDWLIHGVILNAQYHLTPSLWRPKAEMDHYWCWMLLGQFLIAKFFTILFAKGYEGKGVGEGVRFGLLVGLMNTGGIFIQYFVYPIPMGLMWKWVGLYLLQAIGGGIVASLVYKK